MPRLSLYKPEKGNDFKFLDRTIYEQFQVGGTDVYLHKYLGAVNPLEGESSPTKPANVAEAGELGIQDVLFMENFNERFSEFIEVLPKDWHIFYLGAVLLNSENCNHMMVRAMDTSSLHAYCVNPEFKDTALAQAREYPEHIDVAYRLLHRRYRSYAAKPPLAKQFPSYSDLMLKDVDYLSWYK